MHGREWFEWLSRSLIWRLWLSSAQLLSSLSNVRVSIITAFHIMSFAAHDHIQDLGRNEYHVLSFMVTLNPVLP